MKQWLRWDTLAEGQPCLDWINNSPSFPITNVNSTTKAPVPEKQKSMRWAPGVVECTDGKVGFEAPTDDDLLRFGRTQSEVDGFLKLFKPTVEPYDFTWIKVGEE